MFNAIAHLLTANRKYVSRLNDLSMSRRVTMSFPARSAFA